MKTDWVTINLLGLAVAVVVTISAIIIYTQVYHVRKLPDPPPEMAVDVQTMNVPNPPDGYRLLSMYCERMPYGKDCHYYYEKLQPNNDRKE